MQPDGRSRLLLRLRAALARVTALSAVLAVLVSLAAAPARAQSAAALGAANTSLDAMWQALRPATEADLKKALEGLAGRKFTKSGITIRFETAELLNPALTRAPSLTSASTSGITAAIPAHTASTPAGELWSFQLRARVSFEYKQDWGLFTTTVKDSRSITASVSRLRVVQALILDGTDATRPRVITAVPPVVAFELELSTSSILLDPLLGFLNPYLKQAVTPVATGAAAYLLRDLFKVTAGLPGTPLGQGTPRLTDSGAATDFLTPARAIVEEIRRVHLPHGSLVEATYDAPETGTARTGNLVKTHAHADTAIWTGHLLAALSYQYAAGTAADKAQALGAIREVLTGLDILARVSGDNQLARAAAPYPSADADQLIAEVSDQGVFKRRLDGRDWVFAANVSRDQYCGVFLGLMHAFMHVDVPDVKAQASAIATRLLATLMTQRFIIRQHRGTPLGDTSKLKTQPGEVVMLALFNFHAESRLALLQVGRALNGPRFQATFDAAAPASELAWLVPWIETMDPASQYFKFNLDHGHLVMLMRLETSAARWRHYRRAERILERALAAHQNVYFDMCHLAITPPDRARGQSFAWFFGGEVSGTQTELLARKSQVREGLRRWLQRPSRYVVVDLRNDPSIEKFTYTSPLDGGTKKLAVRPVPIERRPTTDFLWQRCAFDLKSFPFGPQRAAPGVDYILPYWMARYYGVMQQ